MKTNSASKRVYNRKPIIVPDINKEYRSRMYHELARQQWISEEAYLRAESERRQAPILLYEPFKGLRNKLNCRELALMKREQEVFNWVEEERRKGSFGIYKRDKYINAGQYTHRRLLKED